MIATVGPMITAGMSLLIQRTPANLTIIAISTYTSPANAAPMIMPAKPASAVAAPAKAADMEPRNANQEPRNTGLLNLVKSR